MSDGIHSRRRFLLSLTGILAAVAGPVLPAYGSLGPRRQSTHPTPRPGIDASRVVPRQRLAEHPDLAEVFDMVREMPSVADGIRCHCGCAEVPGYYSLLSCFEGDGMAQHCELCQSQARLAHRLHRAGR